MRKDGGDDDDAVNNSSSSTGFNWAATPQGLDTLHPLADVVLGQRGRWVVFLLHLPIGLRAGLRLRGALGPARRVLENGGLAVRRFALELCPQRPREGPMLISLPG